MTDKIMMREYDCLTGKTTDREATASETAQFQLDELEYASAKQAEADKAAAKTSAQAKLSALGLTEDEVKSIVG